MANVSGTQPINTGTPDFRPDQPGIQTNSTAQRRSSYTPRSKINLETKFQTLGSNDYLAAGGNPKPSRNLSSSSGARIGSDFPSAGNRNDQKRFQAVVRQLAGTPIHEPAKLGENLKKFHSDDIDQPIEKLCEKLWQTPLSEHEVIVQSPNGSSALSATRLLANAVRVMVCVGASVAQDKPVIDGLAGAAALVNALMRTGKIVTLVTDTRNLPILREAVCLLNRNAQYLKTLVMRPDDDAIGFAIEVLERFSPQAVVAVGLPGRNSAGKKLDARLIDLRGINPPLDEIINQANGREVDTIAIASHWSQCGMAGVASIGSPGQTVIPARHVVISPTANLGGQLLAQVLFKLAAKKGQACTEQQYAGVINTLLKLGAVDGMEQRSPNEQWINVNIANAAHPTSSDSNRNFSMSDRLQKQSDALRMLNEHATSLKSLPALVTSRQKIQNAQFHIVTIDSSDGGLIAGRNLVGYLKARSQHRVKCDNVGDHLNAPYGDLPRENLITAVRAALNFAASRNPDIIVMACNTACTGSPEIYQGRATYTLDLVNITSNAIVAHGGSHPILLGTLGMVNSQRYPDEVAAISSPKKYKQHIVQVAGGDEAACKLGLDLASLLNRLAHLPEGSEADKAALADLIEKIIDEMVPYLPNATSVWLVCTHYPLIRERLQARLNQKLQELDIFRPVNIIDAMEFQAEAVIRKFDELKRDAKRVQVRHNRRIRAYTSGVVANVERSVRTIYGDKDVKVKAWQGVKVPRPEKRQGSPVNQATPANLPQQ